MTLIDKMQAVEAALWERVGFCSVVVVIMRYQAPEGGTPWRERWAVTRNGHAVELWPVHPDTSAAVLIEALTRRLAARASSES